MSIPASTSTVSRCSIIVGPSNHARLSPFDDVVAEQSRHGQEHRVDQVERLRELEVLLANFVEALLGPIDEIHLVDRDGDVANPEEVGDVAVPFGLADDPMARADQNDRK